MDIVTINDFKLSAIIGIFDWERENKQALSIDLEMATDIAKAAHSDDIEDALDYKAVTDRLRDFVEGSEFQLIETLAENITKIVREEFNVPWVRLRLTKPDAIADANVGLLIERGEIR